jgi:hypothetical protein
MFMKIVTYSDGERIESVVVYEADLSVCLTNLQNEGYLIVREEKVPAPKGKNFDRHPQIGGDERR